MENPILLKQTRTILQQIEDLKNWHKQQQSKLINVTDNTELGLENIKSKIVTRPHLENNKITHQSFDEIPIKVVNPNLNKIIENNINPNNEQDDKSQQNSVKPKFRFLKRGEGIARFRMGPQKAPKVKSKNVWTLNLSGAPSKTSSGEPNSLKDTKTKWEDERSCTNLSGAPPKTSSGEANSLKNTKTMLEDERSCKSESNNIATLNPPDLKLDFKNWKSIFDSGKAEEIFEKAISNNQFDLFQPDSSVDSSTASIMEKFIAVGKKHLKEREELKVFEAIEQHLLDSSFCSNSSYVARLMENAVISTPIKKTFGNQNTLQVKIKTNQLPSVVIEHNEEVTVKENTDRTRPEPAVWINKDSLKETDPKFQEEATMDDLEQSLHVRFAEKVDYKSFVDYSQSMSDSNLNSINTNRKPNDNEEWKEDSGEDSVCCSQCSTSYSSSDEDVEAITPLREATQGLSNPFSKPENVQTNTQNNRNSVNKLDVADLKTKDNFDENKTSFCDDVGLDKLPPVLGLKMKELEHEIETFREENKKLKALRETLEKERKQFQTEKKKFLLEFDEEKKKNAVQLNEEKQKLAKEKFIFEKYSKSISKNPSKEERKEIQGLKEQLAEMKEELNKKESRWGAAQARVRNQVKVLEDDNKKLREEVEILRKQGKHLEFLTHKKNKPFNNTKLIHAISEYVSSTPIEDENVAKSLSGGGYFDPKPNSIKTVVVDEVNPQNIVSVKVIKENRKENKLPSASVRYSSKPVCESNKQIVSENGSENSSQPSYLGKQIRSSEGIIENNVSLEGKGDKPQIITSENLLNSPKELVQEDETVEKIYPDGKREIKYKNGNIKRIDPYSATEKTIYFNGDVKENLRDGTVKYYFSESRIWHTTLPDGLEVLDFPSGQVEKRHTNGMVEIIYPNDCRKLSFPDGTEEIIYADGTKLKIETDKKRVLYLPNGQREIHTEECVRREYPDGTVKVVYPDGVTETIYANGRVRLKDKHGNLVMDSAKSTNRPIT